MLQSLRYFVETTTTHGPRQITESRSCWRVIWLVAMLVAWGFMIYQLAIAAIRFSKYPIKSMVTQAYKPDVPFPAVTICNLNPLRKSAKETTMVFGNKSFNDLFLNLMEGTNHTTLCMVGMLKAKIGGLIFENPELAKTAGYRANQTIMECVYSYNSCPLSKIVREWQHKSYGNCFTLMPQEGRPLTGPDNGLQLMLSVQVAEYENAYNPSVGLRVEVHPEDVVPFPEDNGFIAAAGNQVNVAVVFEESKHLQFPYGMKDCIVNYTIGKSLQKKHTMYAPMKHLLHPDKGQNHNMTYSILACMKSCNTYNLIENCSCINAAAGIMSKNLVNQTEFDLEIKRDCDSYNQSLMDCIMNYQKDPECLKACPQACKETKYQTQITTSDYPDAKFVKTTYINVLQQHTNNNTKTAVKTLKNYGIAIPSNVTDLWGRNGFMKSPKFTNMLKENLVFLNIYFATFNYVIIADEQEITVVDFLGNMGGSLGLFSGMSFLSLLEFVQLIWNLSCSKGNKVASARDHDV